MKFKYLQFERNVHGFKVLTTCQGDWWSAYNKKHGVAGMGESEEAAILAIKRCLIFHGLDRNLLYEKDLNKI